MSKFNSEKFKPSHPNFKIWLLKFLISKLFEFYVLCFEIFTFIF
jgi:hypothetical protein